MWGEGVAHLLRQQTGRLLLLPRLLLLLLVPLLLVRSNQLPGAPRRRAEQMEVSARAGDACAVQVRCR